MSYPIPSVDPENINPNLPEENEMSPAETWTKIAELAKSLENDVKDLQDLLAKPAFAFDENGKMII